MNRYQIARDLTARHGLGDPNLATPTSAILEIRDAVLTPDFTQQTQPRPDKATLLDALRLLAGAREDLDHAEIVITHALRTPVSEQDFATWAEIGTALGFTSDGSRNAAIARFRRLRQRYPSHTLPGGTQ